MDRFGWLSTGLLALLTIACEQTVIIRGTVTIPLEVQARFGNERKGVAIVRSAYTRGGSPVAGRTIGILCGPQGASLELPFEIEGFGCVKEIIVEGSAVELTPADAGKFERASCGPMVETDFPLAGAVVGYGSKVIWEDKLSGRCKSGTAEANIVLSLRE